MGLDQWYVNTSVAVGGRSGFIRVPLFPSDDFVGWIYKYHEHTISEGLFQIYDLISKQIKVKVRYIEKKLTQ